MSDSIISTTGFRFNRIYLVESLPLGDLRTGEELYDAVLAPAAARGDGPRCRYYTPRTRQEFLAVLQGIADETSEPNVLPLLHIDAHGSPDGLRLADQSLIDWATLSAQLLGINTACRMNLLVVASMCHGWFLMEGALPSGRSPLFAVIGPSAGISAGALVDAVKRFYVEAVRSSELDAALLAMNEGKPFADWQIRPGLAEILFCRGFREFWAGTEIAGIIQERENHEVAVQARIHNLTLDQSAEVRLHVRSRLQEPHFWYEELRRRFLMLDLFPDNHDRFQITWQKCKPAT